MFGQWRSRWSNVKWTLVQWVVFTGKEIAIQISKGKTILWIIVVIMVMTSLGSTIIYHMQCLWLKLRHCYSSAPNIHVRSYSCRYLEIWLQPCALEHDAGQCRVQRGFLIPFKIKLSKTRSKIAIWHSLSSRMQKLRLSAKNTEKALLYTWIKTITSDLQRRRDLASVLM